MNMRLDMKQIMWSACIIIEALRSADFEVPDLERWGPCGPNDPDIEEISPMCGPVRSDMW